MEENKSAGFENSREEEIVEIGNTYFFGIGINAYKDFRRLNNAVKDVEDIGQLLINQFGFSEKKPFYKVLVDKAATRRNIIRQLNVLAKTVELNDRVFIYYSGHGYLDEKTELGYWIPVNAEKEFISDYVTNSDVRDIIKAMDCRHILLISDSCFSGSLLTRAVVEGGTTNRAFYDWERKASRWVVSSGKGVVSDGKAGQNSPFATQLLEHLAEVKEQININDLANKVTTSIQYNYEQQPEASPLFAAGHKGGQFIFYKNGVVPKFSNTANRTGADTGATKSIKAEVNTATPSSTVKIEHSQNVLTGNVIQVDGDLNIGDINNNKPEEQPTITKPKTPTKKMPNNLTALKKQLKDLVEEGELKEALELFKKHLRPGVSLENDLVLLSARNNSNNKNFQRGLVAPDDKKRELARINYALTSYIDDLEEEDVQFLSNTTTAIEETDNAMNFLSALEKEGLEIQATLTQKKLNRISKALILENDPARQFAYEEQIEELKKQLAELKQKIG